MGAAAAALAERRERQGIVVEHPNRAKASSKVSKLIVTLLLLVSAFLVTVVTIGGWDVLQGAKFLQVAYILLYLVLAFFVLRWQRGVLPVIAALAMILLIFAAVAGPEWFSRDKDGFTSPTLNESVLGLVTLIIVPVQLLLIAFAMQAFNQAWNVEVERRPDGTSDGD
jgi:presenilin-like A22 family membrane protease